MPYACNGCGHTFEPTGGMVGLFCSDCRPILTAETITEDQIRALCYTPAADEWIEANGRRLRLSYYLFDAVHGLHEEIRYRARTICAEFINKREGRV